MSIHSHLINSIDILSIWGELRSQWRHKRPKSVSKRRTTTLPPPSRYQRQPPTARAARTPSRTALPGKARNRRRKTSCWRRSASWPTRNSLNSPTSGRRIGATSRTALPRPTRRAASPAKVHLHITSTCADFQLFSPRNVPGREGEGGHPGNRGDETGGGGTAAGEVPFAVARFELMRLDAEQSIKIVFLR